MKVEGSIKDALVMTMKEQQGIKDPTRFYYIIGIVKDEELGEIRCTEEVYKGVKKMCSYDFGFIFNSQYGTLQIDRVLAEYGTLEQQAENNAIAAAVVAVPESAPEEKAAAPDQEQKEAAAAPESAPGEVSASEQVPETKKASKK